MSGRGTRFTVVGKGYGVEGMGCSAAGAANGTRYAVPCPGYI